VLCDRDPIANWVDGRAALRNTILGSSTPEQHYDRIAWVA
jgi:hypothetical protein